MADCPNAAKISESDYMEADLNRQMPEQVSGMKSITSAITLIIYRKSVYSAVHIYRIMHGRLTWTGWF